MGRNILAGVAGVVVAMAIVWFVEVIGHNVYPPPPELNFADKEAMRDYVATLPVGALLFVAAAWFLGTLGGTLVASRFGKASSTVYALIVGGIVLLATAANLVMIPHPIGFSIPAVAGIIVAAWLGMTIGGKFKEGDA